MIEKRWVLLVASEVGRTDSVSDRAMERLVEAIGEEGYEAIRTTSPEDGLSLVTSDPATPPFCWTGTWRGIRSLKSAPRSTLSAAFATAIRRCRSS